MYWLIVEHRKWKFLPRPRVRSFFVKEGVSFAEVKDFVNGLREEYRNNPYKYVITVGVARGKVIQRVH